MTLNSSPILCSSDEGWRECLERLPHVRPNLPAREEADQGLFHRNGPARQDRRS